MDYQSLVKDVLTDVSAYRGQGTVARHIPALARVNPTKLGIALALADGSTFIAGDGDESFSIQSLSFVFALPLALSHLKSALWNYVGREPAGLPVDSLVQLEFEKGHPRNPLINAGAIVVCDRLMGVGGGKAAEEEFVDLLRDLCGAPSLSIDESLAMADSRAGAFNRSLAYLLSYFGNLDNPPDEVLSLYYRQCSVAMTCRQVAQAALFLAFDGNDPRTGEVVTTSSRARRINALMMTSGHYDSSGDFAFRVGLPGKSAASGAIMAVVPRIGAVCVWSPGLNAAGMSLVGTLVLERLVERTGWSVFV
jgi:glutaminase